jgi:hypothetical protein
MLTETRVGRGRSSRPPVRIRMLRPLWIATSRALRRLPKRWIATAALGLIPALASADHTGLPPIKSGLDWMTWLLIAGAIAAVGLAAWAFFAPDRPEAQPGPPPPERSKSEPPGR